MIRKIVSLAKTLNIGLKVGVRVYLIGVKE